MIPPYKRFEAINTISKLEHKCSSQVYMPYMDELDQFYKDEYKFITERLLDIDSTKILL